MSNKILKKFKRVEIVESETTNQYHNKYNSYEKWKDKKKNIIEFTRNYWGGLWASFNGGDNVDMTTDRGTFFEGVRNELTS